MEVCFSLSKFGSFNFDYAEYLWQLVKIEVHTVPHFKAPVNCKVESRGPEHGGFLYCKTLGQK